MKVVASVIGSWGDLFPFIPVAHELVRRGHEVTFAAPSAMGSIISAEGFGFTPVGDGLSVEDHWSHPEIVDRRLQGLVGFRNLLTDFILPRLSEMSADLTAALAGANVLLASPGQLAAPIAAEAAKAKWITVSVFPGMIPSAYTVPQGSVIPQLSTPVGRLSNRVAWGAARAALRVFVDREVNKARREMGAPRLRDAFFESSHSPLLTLVLSSPAYSPRPPDWPGHVKLTGFSLFDRPAREVSGNLETFLATGERPVVATIGFTGAIDPRDFYVVAVDALRSCGRRGVILVGRPELVFDAGADMCVVPFAPLSSLLPVCDGIIHAGGYGTTAMTLFNGLPSVVVPRAHDQLFHADRIRRLRAGVVLSPRKFSVPSLSAAIRRLLRDDRVRKQSEAIGKRIQAEDGPRSAADEIERVTETGGQHQ